MKKLSSILVAFALLLQSTALAGTAESGAWTVKLNGSTNTNTEKYFAMIASEAGENYKYDGEDSLYIEYPGNTKTSSEYIEITNTLVAATEQGESYKLTFYIKGKRNSNMQEVLLGSTILETFDNIAQTKIETANAPSGQSSWYKAEYDFTATSVETKLSFRIYGGTSAAAIDEVSLVKTGTTDNIIKDGGFEAGLAEEEIVEEWYDRTPYTPLNIMASPSNAEIVLNWKNPTATTLTGIAAYNITGGKNELISDSFDTTPSKTILYEVEGLENGENYQFKVVFSFSDKGNFTYYLGGIPSDASLTQYSDWSLNRVRTGQAAYCPGEIGIDSTVSKTGNASLRFKSNIDRSYPALASNIYMSAILPLPLEQSKTYQISFWSKGNNISGTPHVHMKWNDFDDHNSNFSELAGTYDWKKITVTYTYTSSNILYFISEDPCASWWIDDIEVYEIENGEIVSENLAPNASFEDLVDTEVAEISELTATPKIGGIDLDCIMSSDDYKMLEIYQKFFDEYLYAGTIIKGEENISLTGLDNGREYTFKLVPVNNNNVKGQAKEVTATTILPDYETGSVILKMNNAEVDGLYGAGNYSLNYSVKNNVFENGMDVVQFVVIYDENNCIKNVYSTSKKINKTGIGKSYTNITTSFTLPAEKCSVEYFVFDTRETLNIIGETNPHKVFVSN